MKNKHILKISVCVALSALLIFQLITLLIISDRTRMIKSETAIYSGKLVSIRNEINNIKNETAKLKGAVQKVN